MADGKARAGLQKLWRDFEELLAGWRKAYPGVDIPREIRKAHAWELSNPEKRKVNRVRFLNSWLARQQDRGRAPAPGADSAGPQSMGERLDSGEGFQ